MRSRLALRSIRAACRLAAIALLAALGGHPAHAQSAELDEDPAQPRFQGELGAGAGLGRREVRLPAASGEQRLTSGLFPALDLAVRGEGVASEHVLLGLGFRYRTSIGLVAEQTPELGTSRHTALRSHHVELGATPAVRFATSPRSAVLGLHAGWALRGLRAVVDVTLPAYTLHGPLLRLELRVPIGDALRLRLAPELFVPISAGDALGASGLTLPGPAFGGEAALALRLGGAWALELGYRDVRASLSADAGRFTDAEQFGTLRALLSY